MSEPQAISVYAVGAQVDVGGIRAVVTAVIIREAGHVTYEVVWWKDGSRNCVMVEAWEVEVRETSRLTIGFLPPNRHAAG